MECVINQVGASTSSLNGKTNAMDAREGKIGIKWNKSTTYLSILLTGLMFLALATGHFGWTKTWTFLGIPTLYPPFADMRTIQGALASLASGRDPQIDNPGDPWGRLLNYPMLWVDIARALRWDDEWNYLLSAALCVWLLWGCWGSIVYRFPSPWILLTIFSGSNLLLMERGNNDSVVFCLTYLSLLSSSAWLAASLIFVGVVLKIYPLFSCTYLLRNKTVIAALLGSSAAFAYMHAPEFFKIRSATPISYLLSYGSASLSLLLKTKLGFNINYFLITFIHLTAALFILTRKDWLDIMPAETRGDDERRMFLAGGSVYTCTFMIFGNWDYRLVFLVLCVPFVLRLRNSYIRLPALLSFLLASNQLILQNYLGTIGSWLNILSKSFLVVVLLALILRELSDEIGAREFGESAAGFVRRLTSRAIALWA